MLLNRKLFVALAVVTVSAFGGMRAYAQFTAPTCTPPNCSPAVIQNIAVTAAPQTASINVTGDAKLGATFQAGASAPVLNASGQNLFYGNVGVASNAGSLLLLQVGGTDRLRVGLNGELAAQGSVSGPAGSAAAPAFTFNSDGNTGLYSIGADQMGFSTNGVQRFALNNSGATVSSGQLLIPGGTATAPTLTFLGDSNMGIYRSAADTLNFSTNGTSQMFVSSTGTVVVPGTLVVQTALIAPLIGGNGSTITDINADYITSGTLNDARLSPNVALLNRASQTFTGNNTFSSMTSLGSASLVTGGAQNLLYGVQDTASLGSLLLLQTENAGAYTDKFRVAADGTTTVGGNVTAPGFAGSGAGLTNLNASQLTTGTVPDGRLAGTYSGTLTFSGLNSYTNRSAFGSASLAVGAGQSLVAGNIDAASAGNLLQLQNENIDRLLVDAAGNLTAAGNIAAAGALTSGGQNVCLQNGANCPVTLPGSGTPNRIVKFTGTGATVGDSTITDNGTTATAAGNFAVSGTAAFASNVTVDTDTLFADAAANNVGIGTLAPLGKLHVADNWDGSNGALTLEGDRPTIRFNSTQGAGSNEKWIAHVGNAPAGSLGFYEGTNGTTWNSRLAIAPHGTLTVNTAGTNWNEGIEINPSTANDYNALFFRQTAGSIANSWFFGRFASSYAALPNALGVVKEGLGGMSGTSRADSPFAISQDGQAYFGGVVNVPHLRVTAPIGRTVASEFYARGSGGTNYGLFVDSRVVATTNYGLYADVALGANNWGVYIVNGNAAKPGGGSWSVSSDARLKKDVSNFTDGLNVLRKLRPVNYTYNGLAKTPEGMKSIGVIAQEVQEIAPYMVFSEHKKLRDGDATATDVLYFDASALPFINANAIRELDLRIEGFEAKVLQKNTEQDDRIRELESEVEALKRRLERLERAAW